MKNDVRTQVFPFATFPGLGTYSLIPHFIFRCVLHQKAPCRRFSQQIRRGACCVRILLVASSRGRTIRVQNKMSVYVFVLLVVRAKRTGLDDRLRNRQHKDTYEFRTAGRSVTPSNNPGDAVTLG